MKRIVISSLFVCMILLQASSLSAQVLHAVIVGDTSPSAGWGKYTGSVAMDLMQISTTLEENMPESQVDVFQMEIDQDEYCSPQNVLGAINDLNVRPNDAILFYFSGHGSADDSGHFLALAKGKLYRRDLLAALTAKKTRLVALITDCCNTRSDGYFYARPYIEIKSPPAPTPLFRRLFLESKGIVDINSSSPGESAFFTPFNEDDPMMTGSIFTGEWLAWMHDEMRNPRTWDEMVRAVSLRVHKSFHDHYPRGASIAKGAPVQTQQNVYPFQYPGMPPTEGPRTGMLLRDFVGRGSVITGVTPNSPATQVYLIAREKFISLRPQQVVISVNGKPTRNTEAVVQAVNASPQIMRLTVRDPMQGKMDVLLRMKY